jgi:serine/threonine protein kinase
MEFIEGQSLYDYVETVDKLTESQAKTLTQYLLQAVEYVHNQDYIHQDIKTENILLPKGQSPDDHSQFENMKVCWKKLFSEISDILININYFYYQLIDFGFCRKIDGEKLKEYCGSYHYLAPEMITRQPYGQAVDLWSVGVVLYIL